jgi:hypothetical protein
MDHNLLCSWLGLPAGSWPPNHYALLGLKPGSEDVGAIEASVHERMSILRRYQLTNPDLATEAMNRLAQAMICLTDETARRAYLHDSFPEIAAIAAPAEPQPVAASPGEPAVAAPQNSAEIDHAPDPVEAPIAPPTASAPHVPVAVRLDAVHTRRDLYFRIARTRQIQHLWDRVGMHLSNPRRRFKRPAEATALIQHMQALPKLIQSFPSQLGQAGQPGYLVLALARQQLIVPTLQTLLPSQRMALARDWEAGKLYLREQYRLLRDQSQHLRRRSVWSHLVRLTRSVLNNHSGLVLFAVSLLALNVAFPWLAKEWLRQLAVLLCLVLIRVVLWWARSRPTGIPLPEPSVSAKRKARRKRDQLSGRGAKR